MAHGILRPTRVRLMRSTTEGTISGWLVCIGPGLTLYGLRHTVAVILREMGYDERTIADALGQSDPKMALHYAKLADLKPKMRGVVTQFDVELDKRKTKTVKPSS